MKLYHFTALMHLEPILREGLKYGEAPVDPRRNDNAVSLTADPSRQPQACWSAGSAIDKTKVRLAMDLDEGDPLLERQLDFWKRKRTPRDWVRALDASGQAKHWWFYHGTIPRKRFAVEVMAGGRYALFHGLDALAAAIAEERARLKPYMNDERYDEGRLPPWKSWLMDGTIPCQEIHGADTAGPGRQGTRVRHTRGGRIVIAGTGQVL